MVIARGFIANHPVQGSTSLASCCLTVSQDSDSHCKLLRPECLCLQLYLVHTDTNSELENMLTYIHRFPAKKEEQWWLVVGDPKANTLLAIKRVSLQRKATQSLAFQAPSKLGRHELKLYFMSDSYIGCDQVRKPAQHLLFPENAVTSVCNL